MKETISFRIEKSNREKLDLLAQSLNSDRSALIDEAIRSYLDFNAWFVEQVELGIEEADRGDFIDSKEVKTTFERLLDE